VTRCLSALLLTALALHAQTPAVVRQGDTLRLHHETAATARMGERSVKLYVQPDGSRLALMPIPVNTKPGRYEVEYLDRNGLAMGTLPVTVRDGRFPTQNIVISKSTSELKPAPGEQEAVNVFRTSVSEVRLWSEPFERPVPGCMTSPFGVRRLHNKKPTGDYHAGLDQRGDAGTPIHAITGGTIKIAKMFNLRGGTVAIDHGQGVASIYMHMSRVIAAEGAVVRAGDVIGEVGSTGRSTAPHLHWTFYVYGVPANPLQWIKVAPCTAGK